MRYAEYLRRLPKVELHCHVEGTLRPQTVVDLAKKHAITLPTSKAKNRETRCIELSSFRRVAPTRPLLRHVAPQHDWSPAMPDGCASRDNPL